MGDANYENTEQALCSHMMILGTDHIFFVGRVVRWAMPVTSEKELLYKFVKKFNAPEHWPIPLYQTPSIKLMVHS